MKDIADFMVRIPVRTKNYLEDAIDSCQPMTSLFEQSVLLLGDVLAKMIIDEWLSAEFEGGRHQTRVDMITAIENK